MFPDASPLHIETPLIDFHDHEDMYRTKPMQELIWSFLVLKSCQFPPIVTLGAPLLEYGGTLTALGAKYTYFRYFCAGEHLTDPRIEQIVNDISVRDGMQAILDYSVEGASSDEGADAITATILDSIRFSWQQNSDSKKKKKCSFGVVKISGIADCDLLEKISRIICYEQQQQCVLQNGSHSSSSESMLPKQLLMDNYHRTHVSQRTPAYAFHSGSKEGPPQPLTDAELAQLDRVIARLDTLCEASAKYGVPLLVDAEQTYVQPAIDQLAMLMCLRYNDRHDGSGCPILYNTYQMYLKDAFYRLEQDTQFATERGVRLGAKLVRGAYMKTESARSESLGLPYPVNSSLEATHESFHAGVHHCLSNIDRMGVLVASHNQNSIYNVAHWIVHQYGLDRSDRRVQFAQLYGMGDYLSLSLVRAGFNVSKYTPFGPLQEVLPYLSRRLIENGDMLGGAVIDLRKLKAEICRRAKQRWAV